MTIRTIKVDITGLKEIEKAQKSVSALRDSVLDFEKKLKKMGGKNTSPLSFNVNLNLNTDKALRDYLSLKKQIENIPIMVGTKKGKATETSLAPVDKTQVTRPKEKVAEYVKVRDQDYQSWRNLHKAVQDVTTSTMGLSSQMIKLGAVNPAKGLLSVFNKVNSTVMGIQNNIMGLVGNKVTGALSNAIQGTLGAVKSGVGQLKDEANNLGDAMQVYRINMEALGFSEKETNKSIKRLGDYGKASVFDATDLLEQASTYTAYGRKDAEDIVRGYAGLLAQTKNPVQGMKTVTTQTSQMLANGYLNQGDYRFIRERLSALGASKLNEELLKIAQSKGEDSITDATRKKLITANEYLDAVNKLGNQDIFQNLVTSIVTPRQAIANFKETLSNLLVFDEIDEEGNAKPGALNQVYVATRDFIKGITEIVGTDKFKEYVTKLGNAIGGTIQQVNQFGSAWKLTFGSQILKGIETFAKNFKEGVSGLDVSNRFFSITKDMLTVLNSSGKEFGQFTKDIVHTASEFLSSISQLTTQAINANVLKVLSQYVDVYNNLAKLAVKSEAVKQVVSIYDELSKTLNNIVKSINPQDVKGVFEGISTLAKSVINFVDTVATKTNLISNFAIVLKTALKALGDIVTGISTFDQGAFNRAVDSLREALVGIIEHLKPLLTELGKGIISALSSSSAKAFFKAVENFVKAVTNAIKQTLVAIGGSVEGGLKKILDFLTLAVNVASGIATLLGGVGKYIVLGYIGTKFVSWATSIITSLTTVATAMASATNGRINPLGLGGNFGGGVPGAPVQGSPKGKGVGFKQGVKNAFLDSVVAYNQSVSAIPKPTAINKFTAGVSAIGTGFTKFGKYIPKIASVAKGVATIGGSLVLDAVNTGIQNSKVGQGWKDLSDAVASTATWAGTGTMIGGVPGAIIGGAIGLGTSLWGNYNRRKEQQALQKEADKEAQQLKKEQGEQALAYIKDLGKQVSEVQGNFFAQLGNGENGLQLASAFVDSLTTLSNGDLNTGKRSVGLNTQAVPKGIENYFVELNGKLVKWADLKSQTGLSDEKLLATIEQLYSALGRPFVEFKDEAGTVIETVNTLTKGEQARRDRNLQSYKDNLAKLGLSYKEGSTPTFGDISALDSKLSSSLEGSNFANNEDQKNAILSSLEEVGLNIEGIRGYTLEQLKELATNLRKGATTLGKSAKEENTSKIDAIKKEAENHGGVISEDTAKKLGSMNGEELDKYLKDLHSTNLMTHNVTAEQRSHKVAEFREKLEELGKTVNLKTGKFISNGLDLNSKEYENLYTTLSDKTAFVGTIKKSEEKAREVLTKMGITSVDLQNKILEKIVNGSATSFKDAIEKVAQETQQEAPQEKYSIVATDLYNIVGKFVKDGTIPLEKAKEILKGYDPASVDTSKLDTNGQELYNNVSGTMDSTANKMKEGADKSKVDMSTVDTKPIENAGISLKDSLSTLVSQVAEFIKGLFNGNTINDFFSSGIADLGTWFASKVGIAYGRKKSRRQQSGGIVPEYHSNGLPVGIDWKSRGTDTVPTMLTPGEYVLRKKAVDSLGTNFLNNLNKYGVNALQTMNKSTIINNVYNTNNAKISQNIDNKSQYLNGMFGVDKLMRYV